MPTDMNAEMAKHAEAAVQIVQSAYQQTLDYSEPSIGAVESILGAMSAESNNPDEMIGTTAVLFGSYLGEMIRTLSPRAYWTEGSLTPDAPPPTLVVGDIIVSPIAWCFKRVYNGPQDSVVEKYLAFRQAAIERGLFSS